MIAALLNDILLTYRDPRAVARRLIAKKLPAGVSFQIALLGISMQAAISAAAQIIAPNPNIEHVLNLSPTQMVLAEAALLVTQFFVVSGLGFAVGRRFGGHGTREALATVVGWYLLALTLVSAAILAVSALSTVLGGLAQVAGVAFSLWLLASLIGEAHGFKQTLMVALGIIGVGFAVVAVTVIALSWIGL